MANPMSNPVPEVPFTVDADLELGNAAAPWLRAHGADVVIRRGPVPETLADMEKEGAAWEYAPGRVLVKPPAGMRFLVEGGDTIRYATEPGVDDVDVRLFLLGSAWGALVLQRGLLPLHASAVCVGEDVFGFTGHPGAGKSTLAAALAARGRRFFADDVLVLDPASFADSVRCWGYKDLKLWPDAVKMTGAASGQRVRTVPDLEKTYAAPAIASTRVSGRLRKLYVLIRRNSDRPCQIKATTGLRSMVALRTAVYRRPYALAIAGEHQLYRWLAALAASVSVLRFERPFTHSQFDDTSAHMDRALPR